MANKTSFRSLIGKLIPDANARNEAGGRAYDFGPRHALAQLAATGFFNGTFYVGAEDQIEAVLRPGREVSPEFLAKTAVWTRQHGYMKDTPAFLCALLSVRDGELLERIFHRVIDNGRMVRTFVQILRSGVVGRKSLGSRPKRLVRRWLELRSNDEIFRASVGQSPSLADILRMVHPKPEDAERDALYGYLLGREYDAALLPERVRAYEAYKSGATTEVPDVPFLFLTALGLDGEAWRQIARRAPWHTTRMNLNTFQRHGVLEDFELAHLIAARLRDPELIRRARAFPYQLLAAWKNAAGQMPNLIRNALQDAMEISIENVPRFDGVVYVFPDVSGSMHCPVTGHRRGSSSKVECIDVAALVAAAILRRNPDAEVIPFHDKAVEIRLNGRDSVTTNARLLAAIPAGATRCSAPLRLLNRRKARGDLVIFVSDNESWVGPRMRQATETMVQWRLFQQRNRQAKMVCIDIQPYLTTQACESAEVLNIGGFSDQVFEVIGSFARGELGPDHWVGRIEALEI